MALTRYDDMPGLRVVGQMSPVRDDLTLRLFRAMYPEFDLRTVGGIHVVVPRGTPWFAGHSLGEIARRISEYEHPHTDHPPGGDTPADPGSPGATEPCPRVAIQPRSGGGGRQSNPPALQCSAHQF